MNDEEVNDLPFNCPIKVEQEKRIYDENNFRTIARPDLYSYFDNLLKIRDKKFLIESENDIDLWEEDIDNKIEKVINLLDSFLENIVEYKDNIGSELRKYYFKGRLQKLIYMEVQTYMMSSAWDILEGLNSSCKEDRFKYEKYVDLEEFAIYQVLLKNNKSKFILILIPSIKENNLMINFKKEESDLYYLLDLTEEYLKHNKNK